MAWIGSRRGTTYNLSSCISKSHKIQDKLRGCGQRSELCKITLLSELNGLIHTKCYTYRGQVSAQSRRGLNYYILCDCGPVVVPGAESRALFGNERRSPPISHAAVRAYTAIQRTQAIQVTQVTQVTQTSLKTHWGSFWYTWKLVQLSSFKGRCMVCLDSRHCSFVPAQVLVSWQACEQLHTISGVIRVSRTSS